MVQGAVGDVGGGNYGRGGGERARERTYTLLVLF